MNQFGTSEKKLEFKSKVEEFIAKKENTDQKLILYLDGFDEFGEGREKILDLVGIKEKKELQQRCKVIVSCRSTEISGDEIKDIFMLKDQPLASEVGYICPVNRE